MEKVIFFLKSNIIEKSDIKVKPRDCHLYSSDELNKFLGQFFVTCWWKKNEIKTKTVSNFSSELEKTFWSFLTLKSQLLLTGMNEKKCFHIKPPKNEKIFISRISADILIFWRSMCFLFQQTLSFYVHKFLCVKWIILSH